MNIETENGKNVPVMDMLENISIKWFKKDT